MTNPFRGKHVYQWKWISCRDQTGVGSEVASVLEFRNNLHIVCFAPGLLAFVHATCKGWRSGSWLLTGSGNDALG